MQLNKPLRGPALLAVLGEATLPQKQVAADDARFSRLQEAEHGKLLIDLLEGDAIDTHVRIATSRNNDDLWIDPELRQYVLGTNLAELKDFLRAPLQAGQIHRVTQREYRQHAQGMRPHKLTRLRWCSALACSDGTLIPSIDRSSTFKLAAWPDMDGHSPAFFRMAGLLIKHAVSFDGIVKMTGIDKATAADFVNASYRTGLMKRVELQNASYRFAFAGRSLVSKLRERLAL